MSANDRLMDTVGGVSDERHERTIGAAGRLVVPAALRERFGLQEGTYVVMIPTEAGILLTSREALMRQVWANNHGGDGGDAGVEVRQARQIDRRHAEDSMRRQLDTSDETRTPEQVTADLFGALGIGS